MVPELRSNTWEYYCLDIIRLPWHVIGSTSVGLFFCCLAWARDHASHPPRWLNGFPDAKRSPALALIACGFAAPEEASSPS